ncbi:MAG: DUF2277 domain-containing protein [Polyangiaceae bacterium]
MCRNIRTLHNFEPPATREEIEAAALQYVRKIAGATRPAADNRPAFDQAVRDITRVTEALLAELVAHAPPKNRELEREKAKRRSEKRFASR